MNPEHFVRGVYFVLGFGLTLFCGALGYDYIVDTVFADISDWFFPAAMVAGIATGIALMVLKFPF